MKDHPPPAGAPDASGAGHPSAAAPAAAATPAAPAGAGAQVPTRAGRPAIHTGRGLRLIPLIGVIYCLSAAGPAGIEEMVSVSGPGLTFLLLFLLPVFYGLPLGLASGELNSRYPVEGGYYRWVKIVFGDFWGFQAGWWSWLGAFFDGALYAVWVAEYCDPFLPPSWVGPAHWVVPSLVILLCLWINVRGIEVVGWSTMLFNIFLLSPFVVMCVLGVAHWQHNPVLPWKPPEKGWLPALGVGALMGMWNYSGYESLSTAAEEMENPRRNYIRAILIAILITLPTYILPLLVGLAATPDWTTVEAGSFTDMGRIIGGPILALWIAAAAIISNFALSNVNLLAYSRVPFAMAEDGFLPAGLTRVHRKFGTPSASLYATAICYLLLTFMNVEWLTSIEMWLFSPLYALIFLALWTLRRRAAREAATAATGTATGVATAPTSAGEDKGFVIPAGRRGIWWIILPPIVLMVMAVIGSAKDSPAIAAVAIVCILSGVPLYPLAKWWSRRSLSRATAPGAPS